MISSKAKDVKDIEKRVFDVISSLDTLKSKRPFTSTEADQKLNTDIAQFKKNLYKHASELSDIKKQIEQAGQRNLSDLKNLRQSVSEMLDAENKMKNLDIIIQ